MLFNLPVVSSIFYLSNTNTLLQEKCAGYAKIFAKTHWKMLLKALGD
jgi:hypothetical protein